MEIDHEKLDALILKLSSDVRGFWSKSGCCIGIVNGTYIRIEALDEKEARDTEVEVSSENCCIKESNHD